MPHASSSNQRSHRGLYREVGHAYDEITEHFFVSYAVRGPSFVSEYGGVQYDMPLRGPLSNSTVNQPGPLSSEGQCVQGLENEGGSGVM